jgi:hypothetical protein
MNARKKSEAWSAGVKEHREAISRVTSRRAHFQASCEFTKIRAAHVAELWKEYTKSRWARQRMNLYCGKQRAFAKFFNALCALTVDKSQRLKIA